MDAVKLKPGSEIRKYFPIFNNENAIYNGKDLVYLDSAATTQKPINVILKLKEFYEQFNANVHRGIYKIAERATIEFEESRKIIAEYLGAKPEELIWVKNATEGFNLIAEGLVKNMLKPGDNLVVSRLEHHSNFLPWIKIAKEKDAEIRILEFDKNFLLHEENLSVIDKKTKVVAITQMSNVLGVMPDIELVKKKAKEIGAIVCLDSAQGAAHSNLNFDKIDIDVAVVTAHKLFGNLGGGAVLMKKNLIEKGEPMLVGGGMIAEIFEEKRDKKLYFKTKWSEGIQKFEAGTQNCEAVIGFREGIEFLKKFSVEERIVHSKMLTENCKRKLKEFQRIRIAGDGMKAENHGIVAFSIDGVHPHDIASILAEENIAIRAGHHCASPLLKKLGVGALARVSFQIYNDLDDIDRLILGIKKIFKIFK